VGNSLGSMGREENEDRSLCIRKPCKYYLCSFPFVKVWEGWLIYYRIFWVRRRTWAWVVPY